MHKVGINVGGTFEHLQVPYEMVWHVKKLIIILYFGTEATLIVTIPFLHQFHAERHLKVMQA